MILKRLFLFFILVSILSEFSFSQSYIWTGNSGNNDFFDENNWSHPATGTIPPAGTIDPSTDINADLYTGCGVEADSFIQLGTGSLFVEDGELRAPGINGGKLTIREGGYVELWDADPVQNNVKINFASAIGWLKVNQLKPVDVQGAYLPQIKVLEETASFPTNLRLDNYYEEGCIIRREDSQCAPLKIFDQNNLGGREASLRIDMIHRGASIPGGLDDSIKSFILKRGYMATLAVNENGTGKSKVFIASDKDLVLESLPVFLQAGVSFIRVAPWNWVSKKGIGGNVSGLDNTWFYLWGNSGSSGMSDEYAPMAWGKGGANDQADIDKYLGKYKATHIMGFNEPDDCNGQSGQYFDMCVPDTAINYYENLMKTGLRMVSPACREGAWDDWLNDFNNLAVQGDIRIDVIAVHWYDWGSNPANSPNADPQKVFNRFKNYLNRVHDLYNLPIWITEFNANPNRSTATNLAFMQLALPFLDTLSYVERYAWFQPSSGSADYYDPSGNYTSVGLYYKDFHSSPAVTDSVLASPNNMDKTTAIGVYEPVCNISTSLEKVTGPLPFLIFPNPVANYLHLEPDLASRALTITSLDGKVVVKTRFDKRLFVGNLAKGVYVLRGDSFALKFLKN